MFLQVARNLFKIRQGFLKIGDVLAITGHYLVIGRFFLPRRRFIKELMKPWIRLVKFENSCIKIVRGD